VRVVENNEGSDWVNRLEPFNFLKKIAELESDEYGEIMNKNEKTEAFQSDGFCKNNNGANTSDCTPNTKKTQVFSNFGSNKSLTTVIFDGQTSSASFQRINSFVCDECCLPLRLYGANFIESYTNGKARPMRCLCDIHAAEFGFGGELYD
jgi:hypothetical protein